MSSKIVVITGATRGLGRAMTQEFIEGGHKVIGCGRSEKHVQELTRTFGTKGHFTALDVSDDTQVRAWAAAVLPRFGPPDLLINNAAIINPNMPLWEVPAAKFSDVIDVNIKGVVNVIRAFVPAMVKKRAGVIVNFSSGWGRHAEAQVAPYCATKFAVEALSKSLARELPAGMASIPLNPGVIDTEMLRSCFGSDAGSYPPPEKWAKRAVPFILKLDASQNGESLSVP